MKSLRFCCLAVIVSVLASGCTYSIHQVQVSDFQPYAPIERGDIVKGYGEQFVIMGFTQQTDYVNAAYKNLMNACPSGSLSGITTQIYTAHGFFSWTNKALMQGLCLKNQAKNGSEEARGANPKRGRTRTPSSTSTLSNDVLTDWQSEEI